MIDVMMASMIPKILAISDTTNTVIKHGVALLLPLSDIDLDVDADYYNISKD